METKKIDFQLVLVCSVIFVTNAILAIFFVSCDNWIMATQTTSLAIIFGTVAYNEIKPTLITIIKTTSERIKNSTYTKKTKAICSYALLAVLLPVWCLKNGIHWHKSEGFMYGVRSTVILAIHPFNYVKLF